MELESIVLPAEIKDLAVRVSSNKQAEVHNVLNQIFTGTDDWERQVDAIEVKGIHDLFSIEMADTARKNSKQARLHAEKIFDLKRDEVQSLKLEYDLEDKLWLKAKQIMQLKFKAIEEKAEWKANFVKRYEAEQKEIRTRERINQVAIYAPINRFEFEHMSDESFNIFLSALKAEHEAALLAEQKRQDELAAKQKAEAEERERQQIENARLRAEAEVKEKQIQAERKANEKILAEAKAKAKAEADIKEMESQARLLAEKEARAKIEAELQAKKAAELKAENERKASELKAKKEAEKLAKAPVKKQLTLWVNGFSIPSINIDNEAKSNIEEKFNSFKAWAQKEIENI